LVQQYAPAGAAGQAALEQAGRALAEAAARGQDVAALQERIGRRNGLLQRYVAAYRRYCWDVRSVRDLKLAPFHVLATEGKVHVDRDHIWHMERSEEHTSELQSLAYLVCRLLLDKKKK